MGNKNGYKGKNSRWKESVVEKESAYYDSGWEDKNMVRTVLMWTFNYIEIQLPKSITF